QNTKKKRAANEAEIYKNKNVDKKPNKSNLATQPHKIKSLYNRAENSKPLLITDTENIKIEKADSQDYGMSNASIAPLSTNVNTTKTRKDIKGKINA
ncbi:1251_t:CDS:2, partial [Dentiscutata heterogama]